MKFPKSISNVLQPIISQFSNPRPNSLLYNRWVLYFVFIIALFQLYTFSVAGKLQNIAVFLLVAFLTSFFSKNMTVIMLIALVFTELLNAGFKNSRFEGMTEGETGMEENKKSETPAAATTEKTNPPVEEKANENTKEKEKDKKPTPEEVKKVQEELKENQDKIIQGFQEIEPFMLKAEGLVEKMNTYAKA
jgi:hypothetical protein